MCGSSRAARPPCRILCRTSPRIGSIRDSVEFPLENQTDQRIVIEADRADNRVLEAAAEGAVEAIASGDSHLLALQTWREIGIRSPSVFLEDLRG